MEERAIRLFQEEQWTYSPDSRFFWDKDSNYGHIYYKAQERILGQVEAKQVTKSCFSATTTRPKMLLPHIAKCCFGITLRAQITLLILHTLHFIYLFIYYIQLVLKSFNLDNIFSIYSTVCKPSQVSGVLPLLAQQYLGTSSKSCANLSQIQQHTSV